MKKGIHPENYRLVAFKGHVQRHRVLCRSAVSTKETIEWTAKPIRILGCKFPTPRTVLHR